MGFMKWFIFKEFDVLSDEEFETFFAFWKNHGYSHTFVDTYFVVNKRIPFVTKSINLNTWLAIDFAFCVLCALLSLILYSS